MLPAVEDEDTRRPLTLESAWEKNDNEQGSYNR
jgi:hypothetical protein